MNNFLLSVYRKVDTLVLDFTRYPVCLVCVRNGPRTNRITFETKKIEEKWPVLSIGRTRTSKGHVADLVIGRTLTREGHLLEYPPVPTIGRTLRQKEHPPVPTIVRTLTQKEHPPVPIIGRTLTPKGHLPGHLLTHVIGKILRKEGQLPIYPHRRQWHMYHVEQGMCKAHNIRYTDILTDLTFVTHSSVCT